MKVAVFSEKWKGQVLLKNNLSAGTEIVLLYTFMETEMMHLGWSMLETGSLLYGNLCCCCLLLLRIAALGISACSPAKRHNRNTI